MPDNTIEKFEHDKLLLREENVSDGLIEALQKYHGTEGTSYYSLIHKGIKFNQYVGVIQVGGKQIEVFPKIDQLDQDKVVWKNVLIQMLRLTSGIEAEVTSESQLKVQPNSIFDLYVELFLKECEKLTHKGLIKRYQRRNDNRTALKGRLNVSGQIKHNLVHKERFNVDYNSYDKNHLVNQVLNKTLVVLSKLPTTTSLYGRIKKQLLHFEGVSNFIPTQAAFDSITYGRKNNHYRKAIKLARIILLNYHPDISRGQQHVLALMFDMNKLWEKFLVLQIQRHFSSRFNVKTQNRKTFWENARDETKQLKPDIILEDIDTKETIVIDTKWKVPKRMKPNDQDLRQMFAYNRLFKSKRSILLYPGNNDSVEGEYLTEQGGSCIVKTLDIVDGEGNLKTDREESVNLTLSRLVI